MNENHERNYTEKVRGMEKEKAAKIHIGRSYLENKLLNFTIFFPEFT